MGVAQSVTITGTAMFHHKFLLYFCTAPLALASPQSYFHNFGNQGTYTSVSHGVHHQPAPAPYKPRAPAYHAQAPSVKSFYNQPVAEPAAYHAPLPKPYVHHSPMGQGWSMTGRSVQWTMWRRRLRCVSQHSR